MRARVTGDVKNEIVLEDAEEEESTTIVGLLIVAPMDAGRENSSLSLWMRSSLKN